MSLREKTNRLEVVLTLLLIQLILLPAALGVTYASSSTRPEHILTYTTGRLTWDSATETDGQGAARLELFRRSYDNVTAADGQNVIAPGTAGETVVRLKNNTGRTVSYTAVLYEKKTNAALPVRLLPTQRPTSFPTGWTRGRWCAPSAAPWAAISGRIFPSCGRGRLR